MRRFQPITREIEADHFGAARGIVGDVLAAAAAAFEHHGAGREHAREQRPERIDVAEAQMLGERLFSAKRSPVRGR